MDINSLLHRFEQMGYRFKVDSEKLKVQGSLTDESRELIRQYKTDIIAFLQANSAEKQVKCQAEESTRPVDFQAEAKKIQDVLKKQGLAKIYSETLGEEIWWARDEKEAIKASADAVIYTLSELEELFKDNITKVQLRQIHQSKKLFIGKIVVKEGMRMEEIKKIKEVENTPQN